MTQSTPNLWLALSLMIPVWRLVIRLIKFTHTRSVEHFVSHACIYTRFTSKVSTLTHFLLKPDCEDYSFSDQAVEDFKQGLYLIFTDSIETPTLDASLD